MNGMQITDDYRGGLGCYSCNLQLPRVTAFRCDRIRRAGKSLLAPQERRGNGNPEKVFDESTGQPPRLIKAVLTGGGGGESILGTVE